MLEESANFQEQSPRGDEKKGTDAQGEGLAFDGNSNTSATGTREKMENMSIDTGRFVDFY